MAYGSDFITGGTASASSELGGYEAGKGKDANNSTYWASNNTKPSSWKYDLGSGVSRVPAKVTINPYTEGGSNSGVKNFTIAVSTDDSSYTDVYTGLVTEPASTQSFEFSNSTGGRYFRITCTDNYRVDGYVGFYEIYGYEVVVVNTFVPKIIIS